MIHNCFNYCTIVLLILLFTTTIARKMNKGKLNRTFLTLICLILSATVIDLFTSLGDLYLFPIWLRYVLHTLNILSFSAITPLYTVFVITLSDTWHKYYSNPIYIIIMRVPFIAILAMLVANLFVNNVFSIDYNGVYNHEKLFELVYALDALYVLFGIYCILKNRKLYSAKQFVILILMLPIGIISVLVENYNPHFQICMFLHTTILYLISTVIMCPEETIDSITGIKNFNAYSQDMKRKFKNDQIFSIIMVNIRNYRSVFNLLGYDETNILMNKIVKVLSETANSLGIYHEIYNLDNRKLRIVIPGKINEQITTIAERIGAILKLKFKIKDIEINIDPCVCISQCPQDIKDFKSLISFGEEFDNIGDFQRSILIADNLVDHRRYDIIKNIDDIIENAFINDSFSVYFQPIYSVQKKRFTSAEALLRLKDKQFGFISPDIFIPAAEKNGSISRIGDFVLNDVCKFISTKAFKSLDIEYIEVNLSVAECLQSELASNVISTLDKYKVPRSKINLEITETAAAAEQKVLDDNILKLSKEGINFSLDDYGTGYSNMERIISLPFELIKLDKTFTKIENNPKLVTVIKSTVSMIKDMNMKIVVEGVETKEILDFFVDLECDYIQGYYFSKPLPKDEFVEFIASSAY